MTSGLADNRSDSTAGEFTGLALYDKYSVCVWRYVARLVGADSHAVADAVQETFLAVLRSADRYDPARGTHWAWLSGIAHRQAALYWRRAGRFPEPDNGRLDETGDDDAQPEDQLARQETSAAVRMVLSRMPAESAAVLTAKYADGLSVAEIVEQFGGTTEAVRSRLARARRDFRKRFLQHFPDSDAPAQSGPPIETASPSNASAPGGGNRQ